MAYTKTNWVNGSAPALSAENMNKIEEGIFTNDARLTALEPYAVIASGTDADWQYKKYNDGTYEAWQNYTVNIARQTAYGALYRSTEQSIYLPSFHSGTDYQVMGSSNGGDLLMFNSVAATYFTFFFTRTSSATAADRTARLYVRGKYA